MATRSATAIWHIGQPLPAIEELSQLPLSITTLRRVFFEMKAKQSTLATACSTIADEVLSFWARANILTTAKPHVVSKLKALHEHYVRVAKNKHRKSVAQEKLEAQLTVHLSTLFDVAHADWQKLTKLLADRQFLVDQRGPRKMSMSTEDTNFIRSAEKRLKRKLSEQQRQAAASEPCTPSEPNLTDSTVSEGESSATDDEDTLSKLHRTRIINVSRPPQGSSYEPLPKRCVIEDPAFNSALDRTQTSTRKAIMIVMPALAAAGLDVNQLTMSRSTMMDARNESRELMAASVSQNFQPMVPLVAHFDGKLLPNQDGTMSDHLAIVVSGLGVEKLLGIPIIPVGSGQLMGQKILEFIHEWSGVEQKLAGLCFDTTASNTGVHTGAITIVQSFFSRRLLFLACRHHMLELYAAAVFNAFFASSGPEIELFSRFKSRWDFIDQSKFEPLGADQEGQGAVNTAEMTWLVSRRDEVVKRLSKHLMEVQPRDDYREFAHLTLRLLGEEIEAKFCRPGAYHRSRWMAKGIYCLKIFGFRHQFHLSRRELDSLRRICLFVCTIYATFWFAAPMAPAAPINDLRMLQLVEQFANVDSKVSSVAEKKMRLHLWYLSEDLAGLSLFCNDISAHDRIAIANALQHEPHTFDQPVRRLSPSQTESFQDKTISNFITPRSINLFDALSLPREFLTAAIDTWVERDDFKAACKTIRALKVVNDSAERAIKLATDFNEVLTKNDEQRQLLYQVVEYHRNQLPTNASKTQLMIGTTRKDN